MGTQRLRRELTRIRAAKLDARWPLPSSLAPPVRKGSSPDLSPRRRSPHLGDQSNLQAGPPRRRSPGCPSCHPLGRMARLCQRKMNNRARRRHCARSQTHWNGKGYWRNSGRKEGVGNGGREDGEGRSGELQESLCARTIFPTGDKKFSTGLRSKLLSWVND